MNEETKLPEGLALAVEMLAEFVGIATREERNAAATQRDGAAAVGAIRGEHSQRLTLQHHAADMAQRVADLEAVRDTYKAAWTGYHPLAEYMQGLADGGNLPGMIGEHFGDIAIKRMKGQDARITDLEAERDELRSRTELAESRLAVMVERDGARDEQLRLACRERDGLRARLAEMERQEPVAVICSGYSISYVGAEPISTVVDQHGLKVGSNLYARPVPAIPEGWKLVPVDLLTRCLSQLESDWHQIDGEWGPSYGGLEGSIASGCANEIRDLRAMLAAAPEYKE